MYRDLVAVTGPEGRGVLGENGDWHVAWNPLSEAGHRKGTLRRR